MIPYDDNRRFSNFIEAPAFQLIEIKDGNFDRVFSYGDRKFRRDFEHAPHQYSFIIRKNLDEKDLRIQINSRFLCTTLLSCQDSVVLSFRDIASRYEDLLNVKMKQEFPHFRRPYLKVWFSPYSPYDTKELELLIDVLQDRQIFSGVDLRLALDEGIISKAHWQDLQHGSAKFDLASIDDAFQKCIEQSDDSHGPKTPYAAASNESAQLDELSSCEQPTVGDFRMSTLAETPFKRHQFIKIFQRKLNRFGHFSEGWREPTVAENMLQWNLKDAHNMTSEEQIFLDKLLFEHGLSSRNKEFVREKDSEDDVHLYDRVIIFENWGEQKLELAGLRLSPDFCSVRRLTAVEKKDLITQRLHAAFKAEDQRFRSKFSVTNMNGGYSWPLKHPVAIVAQNCRFINQWYYKAWDKGITTIRRFLDGKRPDTLEKIIRLLQVAYAMGSQDPTNPDFQTIFLEDLARWRTIVPPHDLHLFDAIAAIVWETTFETTSSDMSPEYASNEILLQLQELLSGLISKCPLVNMPQPGNQQDDHPREDASNFHSAVEVNDTAVQRVVGGMEDPRAYADTRKLPNSAQQPDSFLMLMMVGGTFGFIYSFLAILCSFELQTLAPSAADGQFRQFANYLERNLFMLCLYMGCSPILSYQDKPCQEAREHISLNETTSLHPNTPLSEVLPSTIEMKPVEMEPQSSTRSLQCLRCSKTFSNKGNLNRHLHGDCERKARFRCRNPGCGIVVTRKAYRDKHETQRCPKRQPQVTTTLASTTAL